MGMRDNFEICKWHKRSKSGKQEEDGKRLQEKIDGLAEEANEI